MLMPIKGALHRFSSCYCCAPLTSKAALLDLSAEHTTLPSSLCRPPCSSARCSKPMRLWMW